MSQNKEGTEGSEKKPGVKIQDLSPKKDAKGGGGRFNQDQGQSADRGSSPSGGTVNTDKGIPNQN